MDLHFTADVETRQEREAVDAILGPEGERNTRIVRAGAAAREQRHFLLPALHAVNDRVGSLSHGAINYVARRLRVAPAEAYGVATFYALFSMTPRPELTVHVCDDIACLLNGADTMYTVMAQTYGERACLKTACLGLCDRAPAALVVQAGEQPSSRAVASAAQHVGGTDMRLLRRAGRVDPLSLDDYRAHGGYLALRRAFEAGPDRTIAEISSARLVGRGGAAFPTARKMEAVAKAPARPHYAICNADESEPGTFKDRVLMECDPFAIVEGMTISAFAAGCERGYIYVRGEYPLALERLSRAVAQARAHGLLGENVMGKGFDFDVEIRRGAGAYICGEETALFNSIEGKRGEPRNKPPFPAEAGLFGKPTLVNNVETLACIVEIMLHGAETFARTGTGISTGTKLFCVSGMVVQPGLYEVPFRTTLRELIDLAGGVRAGGSLRAVLLGGAAGTFIGPESLDLPLTFEATRAAGTSIGSGAIMLFDDTADFSRIVKRIAEFFRHESCGQCVPCRVGTVRQEEALARGDIALLNDIARVMRDASICGLGQTAANAVESALTLHLLEAGHS